MTNRLLDYAKIFLINGTLNFQQYLDLFVAKENQKRLDECVKYFRSCNHEYSLDSFYVLNPESSLRFYSLITSLPDQEVPIADEDIISWQIFKAYLAINQKNNEQYESIGQNYGDGEKLCKMVLTAVLRYHGLTNIGLIEYFYAQLFKGVLLLKYTELALPSHHKSLLNLMQSSDWKELVRKYVALMLPVIQGIVDHKIVALTPKTNEDGEFLRVLTHVEITDDCDFRPLRSNPLLKNNDRSYSVVYPLFVIDQIYKSLYFRLNRININLPKEEQILEFKSFIGTNFTERNLFVPLLTEIFTKCKTKFSDENLHKDFNVTGAPDYYVRNDNEIFLFELKDVFLKAEDATSSDYKTIEKSILKKFYSNEHGRPKGIKQLVENISKILDNSVIWDKNIDVSHCRIYPILVVTDHVFSCPGLNRVLNSFFKLELKNKVGLANSAKVHDIIVIGIDSLICHKDYLTVDPKRLPYLLRQYSINMGSIEYLKFGIQHGLIPFDEKLAKKTYINSMEPFELTINRIDTPDYVNKIKDLLQTENIVNH